MQAAIQKQHFHSTDAGRPDFRTSSKEHGLCITEEKEQRARRFEAQGRILSGFKPGIDPWITRNVSNADD